MAAGGSSRMGEPKQLLLWKNKTLVENAVQSALGVSKADVYVVFGASHAQVEEVLKPYDLKTIYNPDWKQGLGNSIACGVKHVKDLKYDGVLVILADQPLITSEDLENFIIEFRQGNKNIIASKYENESIGVPVIFDKSYIDELTQLNEDKGAKSFIKKHSENVSVISMGNKLADIDTQEAYQKLFEANHQ
jgi:molybdenum cofactor cytidylyltransferase